MDKQTMHLNQTELSNRWKISPRTLERWRWMKIGPAYLKIGGRVLYRLEDVEQHEAGSRHSLANTAKQAELVEQDVKRRT
ncbi:MAG: DNA-binding protein [Magnetococcales bacterium]|nr:DNA-binding protein [Magnetococcales bacterium]